MTESSQNWRPYSSRRSRFRLALDSVKLVPSFKPVYTIHVSIHQVLLRLSRSANDRHPSTLAKSVGFRPAPGRVSWGHKPCRQTQTPSSSPEAFTWSRILAPLSDASAAML